jgi:hypothetical protein
MGEVVVDTQICDKRAWPVAAPERSDRTRCLDRFRRFESKQTRALGVGCIETSLSNCVTV